MLSDDERAALNVALEKFIAEKNAHDGVVNPVTLYSEAMFAAGIAYAQTQQAAMIAQARADERERAEFLRLALAEIAGSKSLTATPTQFYQYLQRLAADKLNADAESEIAPGVFSAAIRARKDGQ